MSQGCSLNFDICSNEDGYHITNIEYSMGNVKSKIPRKVICQRKNDVLRTLEEAILDDVEEWRPYRRDINVSEFIPEMMKKIKSEGSEQVSKAYYNWGYNWYGPNYYTPRYWGAYYPYYPYYYPYYYYNYYSAFGCNGYSCYPGWYYASNGLAEAGIMDGESGTVEAGIMVDLPPYGNKNEIVLVRGRDKNGIPFMIENLTVGIGMDVKPFKIIPVPNGNNPNSLRFSNKVDAEFKAMIGMEKLVANPAGKEAKMIESSSYTSNVLSPVQIDGIMNNQDNTITVTKVTILSPKDVMEGIMKELVSKMNTDFAGMEDVQDKVVQYLKNLYSNSMVDFVNDIVSYEFRRKQDQPEAPTQNLDVSINNIKINSINPLTVDVEFGYCGKSNTLTIPLGNDVDIQKIAKTVLDELVKKIKAGEIQCNNKFDYGAMVQQIRTKISELRK